MEITKEQALTNLDMLRHRILDTLEGDLLPGLIDEIRDYVEGSTSESVMKNVKPLAPRKIPPPPPLPDRAGRPSEVFRPLGGHKQSDPTGRGQHEPGAKLDKGKVRAALVGRDFGRALRLVAEVSTYGANKYTPQGWASVPDGQERYIDAAFRHLFALGGPESFAEAKDDESGLAHLAHAAWNLLAVLELSERAKEKRGA